MTMPEGGLDEWTNWRCAHDDAKFCPPEGCPKSYGCAREKGWSQGMPTPNGCIGLPETWLIRKSGYFYRPNSRGYTASIYEAGLYSRADAEREAHIEPSITAHPISEYRQLAEVDLENAKRVIALIDAAVTSEKQTPSTADRGGDGA